VTDEPVEDPHALVEVVDGVMTVTLNRPGKLNAISEQTTAILWDAVNRFRVDDAIAVMLIKATGRFFTAGIDLDSRTARGQDVDPGEDNAGYRYRRRYREHHRLYDEMEAIEKPIVVAFHAPTLGAGIEMALSCDFRVAARSATFRLPEVAMGVLPGSGGVSRLTKLVGTGWARWLAMAGREVDADRALAIGLVQEVWDDEVFGAEVQRLVQELAALPREALGLTKLAIDASATADAVSARNIERLANTRLTFQPPYSEQYAKRPRP
jgi:enoyl-CoA hydratase